MRKITERPSLLDRVETIYLKFATEQARKRRAEEAAVGRPARDLRREVVNTLELTYGPILMSVGFFAFFAGTDAAQEVIFGFVNALNDGFLARPAGVPLAQALASKLISIFLLAAVQIFCFSLGYYTLRLLNELNLTAVRVLTMIPILGVILVGLGIVNAAQSPEWPGWTLNSAIGIGFVAAMMVGHLFYTCWPAWWRCEMPGRPGPFVDMVQRTFVWIAVILLLACGVIGIVAPIYAAAAGPIGVAAGFAISGAALLSTLTVFSTLMPGRFPLILLVVLLGVAVTSQTAAAFVLAVAAVLFFFNASRNHPVATIAFGTISVLCLVYLVSFSRVEECITLAGCNIVEGVGAPDARAPELEDAITAFQSELPPDIPLRIVAAQGGGLFAAHQTATYLAARADTDPNFARSLFAISGVSGGSVGAGVYWAVQASGLCQDDGADCRLTAVREIMERDYLSPTLAGLLFRDNVDNVLPVSALFTALDAGPIDRGSVLENALAQSVLRWRRAQGIDPDLMLLDQPIAGSFDFSKSAPLLLMNGTRVDNGERYVLSPIRSFVPLDAQLEQFINDPNDPAFYLRFRTAGGQGLSVVNAMVISARFPVVTPPARIVQKTHRAFEGTDTLQLVDGGYYDNSGIETALDLVIALREAGVSRTIEIVQLRVNEVHPGDALGIVQTQPAIKGTLGAPLSGFFGAWRARIGLSERRLTDALREDVRGANVLFCRETLKADGFNFTLSWYLAPGSFGEIVKQAVANAEAARSGQRACTLASAL